MKGRLLCIWQWQTDEQTMRKCDMSVDKVRRGLASEQVLLNGGADIEAADETGLTPLYYAVLAEKAEMIRVSECH